MKWDRKTLQQKKAEHKIRDFQEPQDLPVSPGRKVSKHFKKKSKEKNYIGWNLLYFCNQNCFELLEEYHFDGNGRRWRFDWYIPALKCGIEYNGLFSEKSRHTTSKGYSGDMQKLNAAQAQGYKVLQFTALTYLDLLKELNKLI